MECCNKCFNDSQLQILTEACGTKNCCQRCSSNAVSVIDPSQLYLHFNIEKKRNL